MDLELTDEVAVVAGASKGIGLAVTQLLATEGAQLIAGARKVDSLTGLARVSPIEVDLVEPGGSERLVRTAVDEHGSSTSSSTTSVE